MKRTAIVQGIASLSSHLSRPSIDAAIARARDARSRSPMSHPARERMTRAIVAVTEAQAKQSIAELDKALMELASATVAMEKTQ